MATKTTKTEKKPKEAEKKQVKKSKIALYLENPNIPPIITKINDMRAVLK